MKEIKTWEEQLLADLAETLTQAGFVLVADALEQKADRPEILIGFPCAGDREDSQEVSLSFLPFKAEQVKELGFRVFELFTCFGEGISFDRCNELARILLRLNRKVPGGAFGIDEEDQAFYYKSTCVLTHNLEDPQACALLQTYTGLFLNTIDQYNDVIMDTIEGRRRAQEAIEKRLV